MDGRAFIDNPEEMIELNDIFTLLIWMAPLFLGLGYFFYKGNYTKTNLIEVEATVVRINEKESWTRHARHIMIYQPEFSYEWKGWTRTVKPEIWSSTVRFQVGQQVTLLIDPKNPGHFRYKSLKNDPVLPFLFFAFFLLLCVLVRAIGIF